MCGRFTIAKPEKVVVELSADEVLSSLEKPRYNIAPMQQVPALVVGKGGPKKLVDIRWGFAPPWADDPATGRRIINARSETIAEKPAFRDAFGRTRCLIPADGFYEWLVTRDGKQPVYIQVDGGGVFVFAGIYSARPQEDSDPMVSCAIVTTTPNAVVKPVHDRMPVILPPESWDQWLDPANADIDALQNMLQPFPAERMTARKVSRLVNSPANDDARCIEPLD